MIEIGGAGEIAPHFFQLVGEIDDLPLERRHFVGDGFCLLVVLALITFALAPISGFQIAEALTAVTQPALEIAALLLNRRQPVGQRLCLLGVLLLVLFRADPSK
jgi:hypothetical protein